MSLATFAQKVQIINQMFILAIANPQTLPTVLKGIAAAEAAIASGGANVPSDIELLQDVAQVQQILISSYQQALTTSSAQPEQNAKVLTPVLVPQV